MEKYKRMIKEVKKNDIFDLLDTSTVSDDKFYKDINNLHKQLIKDIQSLGKNIAREKENYETYIRLINSKYEELTKLRQKYGEKSWADFHSPMYYAK